MTREEIERLEGRELDAVVAEKVMGWVGPARWVCGHPYMAVPVDDEPGLVEGPFIVPLYSSEIGPAWWVVERLNDLGFRVILAQDWDGNWECLIYHKSELVADLRNREALPRKSAPEAICRAAILAVQVHQCPRP